MFHALENNLGVMQATFDFDAQGWTCGAILNVYADGLPYTWEIL
jgi:hypothetical protein